MKPTQDKELKRSIKPKLNKLMWFPITNSQLNEILKVVDKFGYEREEK